MMENSLLPYRRNANIRSRQLHIRPSVAIKIQEQSRRKAGWSLARPCRCDRFSGKHTVPRDTESSGHRVRGNGSTAHLVLQYRQSCLKGGDLGRGWRGFRSIVIVTGAAGADAKAALRQQFVAFPLVFFTRPACLRGGRVLRRRLHDRSPRRLNWSARSLMRRQNLMRRTRAHWSGKGLAQK